MNRMAVAAGALALIGVFVALAVSVVDARGPLDSRVSKSFDATVVKLAGNSRVAEPHGCSKERPKFYRCSAVVRLPYAPVFTARWRLWLHEDGCWELFLLPPHVQARTAALGEVDLAAVRGCSA